MTDDPRLWDDAADPPEASAGDASRSARPRSRVAAAADEAKLEPATGRGRRPGAAGDANPGDDRPVPVRLAGLHLRMGSLGLARAELESLAGRGMLDEQALLDLAEVRWRTGDLAGAGEAAHALLARDRSDTLALVIAAESIAAQGRPGEARRLAARALETADGPLEPLFAGIPRSLIWPSEVLPDAASLPEETGEPIATRTGSAGGPTIGREAIAPVSPAPTGAAEAFAGGLAALGADDGAQAAVRLGVALRLEPAYARDVIEAIGERAAEPALALVMGDALRLLGRESEALAAFDLARGHAPGGVPSADDAVPPDANDAPGDDDVAR